MQETHPSPRFLFWPQYGEEAQWWEEEEEEEEEEVEAEEAEAELEGSNDCQHITHTAIARTSKKKTSCGSSHIHCGTRRSRRGRSKRSRSRCVASSLVGTSTPITLLPSPHANSSIARRFSAIASRTPLLECSPTTNIQVTRRRRRRRTGRTGRLHSKPTCHGSPAPTRDGSTPPQPHSHPHVQVGSGEHNLEMRPSRPRLQTRKGDGLKRHPSLLPATAPSCEPLRPRTTASNSAKCNANPSASKPHTSPGKKMRHLLDFSRFPMGWKFRRLQQHTHNALTTTPSLSPPPPTPRQCTDVVTEEVTFACNEVSLTRPTISTHPGCDGGHLETVCKSKPHATCCKSEDVLSNAAMTVLLSKEVSHLMHIDVILMHHPLPTSIVVQCCSNRVHAVSSQLGQTCTMVHPFSSVHPLLALESKQSATLCIHQQRCYRPLDYEPRNALHTSAVSRTIPLHSNLLSATEANRLEVDLSSPLGYDWPPSITSVPPSPHFSVNTLCGGVLGKPPTPPFGVSSSTKVRARMRDGGRGRDRGKARDGAERGGGGGVGEGREVRNALETMQRVNKLRSIVRVDEWLHSLRVADCVQSTDEELGSRNHCRGGGWTRAQ